jgi:hypothetical protein
MRLLTTPEGRLADQAVDHPITLTGHKAGRRPARLTTRLTWTNLLASLTTLALVGCGRGSSDKSSIPAENKDAFLVLSVPVPKYSGQALKAFETLNVERARCGFGELAQNSQIDIAAVMRTKVVCPAIVRFRGRSY